MIEKDQYGNWLINIPLIGETKDRLERLAQFCGDISPPVLAASLLHDLLEDDAEAHISPDEFPKINIH